MSRAMKLYSPFLVACAALILLVACSSGPPPTTSKLLMYPGAQNVVTQSKPGGVTSEQLATFTTADRPEDVFTFYEHILTKDGWNLRSDLSTSTQRILGWGDKAPGTSFTLAVFIKSTNSKQT